MLDRLKKLASEQNNALLLVLVIVLLCVIILLPNYIHRNSSQSISVKGVNITLDHVVGVGFIFKDTNSPERFCRTPGPDFATGTGGGFSLGLSENSQVAANNTFAAIAMGGRSPGVLVTRELMYRACETAMNTNANPEQTMEIYKFFMEQALAVSKNLAAAADASPPSAVGNMSASGPVPVAAK